MFPAAACKKPKELILCFWSPYQILGTVPWQSYTSSRYLLGTERVNAVLSLCVRFWAPFLAVLYFQPLLARDRKSYCCSLCLCVSDSGHHSWQSYTSSRYLLGTERVHVVLLVSVSYSGNYPLAVSYLQPPHARNRKS